MDIKLEGEMDGIEAAEKIRSKLGIPNYLFNSLF